MIMEYYCPECKVMLLKSDVNQGYVCKKCESFFPVIKGIPSFLQRTNNFYEGKFVATKKRNISWLINVFLSVYHSISISSSRERFIKKAFRRVLYYVDNKTNVRILDLGCGGGWEEITKFGEVTGIDISFESLLSAKDIYNIAVHADVAKMPFPDEYFDIVFSTDLMGHIPVENKYVVLSEIFRVTKKGGHTIHSIESDSESLFFRWAKKYPELYQKYFIEMYGHFGLENYLILFKRFRDIGFMPILEATDSTKGYIREILSYRVFFDNEFKKLSKFIKFLVYICKLLSKYKIIRIIIDFILGFFVPLSILITPKSHRDSIKVIYKKPEDSIK